MISFRSIFAYASIGFAAIFTWGIGASHAEPSLSGPVRLIVPYAAGGGAMDLLGRALQRPLEHELGIRVLVENKPGGSTKIGTDYVMNSASDGQTLLLCSAPGWVGYYYSKVFHDKPWMAMTPIAVVAESPYSVITTSAKGPLKDWASVVEKAKKSGQPIKAGAPAAGGFTQLAFNEILKKFDIKGTFIPYAGAAPARTALLGDELDIQMDSGAAFQTMRSGLTRGVAVSWPERYPLQKDVPTYGELGFGIDMPLNNYTVWGPKGIPDAIVKKLADAIQKATKDPSLIDLLQTKNAMYVHFTPGDKLLADTIKVDDQWADKLKTLAPN
ncbi:MAG: tripartite tricarboxylate transporter substrate binding protein [Rhizobiales bacterium]|nr:tripartite tricarboxylate transporter substrate binding protein [Hyphomicrobiales bacterium]